MNEASERPDEKAKRKTNSSAPLPKRRKNREDPTNDVSDSTESTLDMDPSAWTIEFRQLEQVFRSLNTVYTFCRMRKHFPTTYENLKSSVENLTHRFLHQKHHS
jgi:DEAD/DEAH box helicase domain-containing protein